MLDRCYKPKIRSVQSIVAYGYKMSTRFLYAQTYVHKEIKIIKIIHSILFKLPVVGLNLRVLAAPKKICAVLVSGLTNSKLL